jgi:hypothetical protein
MEMMIFSQGGDAEGRSMQGGRRGGGLHLDSAREMVEKMIFWNILACEAMHAVGVRYRLVYYHTDSQMACNCG